MSVQGVPEHRQVEAPSLGLAASLPGQIMSTSM